MGTGSRMKVERAKYDFYENALFLDDPTTANNNRRPRVCAPKIGTEPRMIGAHDNANPGPQYMVTDKPEFKTQPEYTFGHRRGAQGLKNQISTPGAVGPGRYVPEAASNTSNVKTMPRWTMPKAPLPEAAARKFDRHQTYDNRSGLGSQVSSKNRSSTRTSFGTSNRAGTTKLGTFTSEMRGGASAKMFHARY
jgi:hypothetical protein